MEFVEVNKILRQFEGKAAISLGQFPKFSHRSLYLNSHFVKKQKISLAEKKTWQVDFLILARMD